MYESITADDALFNATPRRTSSDVLPWMYSRSRMI